MAQLSGVCLLAVLLAALVTGQARANGTSETYGPTPRARAMGNAMVAIDDAAAAHTNPAAVGRAPETFVLHTGISVDVPTVGVAFDNAASGATLAVPPPVAGFSLSFLTPIDIVLPGRLFLGVSGFVPAHVTVRARMHDPQRPFFYRYDSANDHYDLSMALGARIFDWLYLGAGLRLAASQTGQMRQSVDPVRGRITEQSIDSSQFVVPSPTAGVLVGELGIPGMVTGSFGFVYRERLVFNVALPATVVLEGADVAALVDILVLSNFAPRTLTAGFGVKVLDRLLVDVEGQYGFWSEAPPPFMRASVTVTGDGVDAVGLEGALDAPASGQERVVAPGFVDTVNVRVGAELKLLGDLLAVRGGYQYRPTPVPDQTSGTNIIDNNAHVLSAGFGVTCRLPWLFAKPVRFDAAYQAQLLEPRSAEKDNGRDEVGNWTADGVVHALALGFDYAW